MISREIPRHEWNEFCDQFSRQHEAWRASLSVAERAVRVSSPEAAETGASELAADLPLEGVSIDRSGDQLQLVIALGDSSDNLTHWVRHPQRLTFDQTDDGSHLGLTIEDADGETTVLRFLSPATPETVNDLAESER